MQTINQDSRLERNPGLVWADVDGETVMMSVERGEYFGLGGVGSRVWELLATPATVAEICETIVAEFRIDPDACLTDLIGFLTELSAVDLVRPC